MVSISNSIASISFSRNTGSLPGANATNHVSSSDKILLKYVGVATMLFPVAPTDGLQPGRVASLIRSMFPSTEPSA